MISISQSQMHAVSTNSTKNFDNRRQVLQNKPLQKQQQRAPQSVNFGNAGLSLAGMAILAAVAIPLVIATHQKDGDSEVKQLTPAKKVEMYTDSLKQVESKMGQAKRESLKDSLALKASAFRDSIINNSKKIKK